ncbi:MAG: ATP-dependent DNA helicase chl1 [Bathelium mastoideum]|nr:MAG: ATP-dependent DNA helicase chl1 [Bathelium mastoideum]
MDTTLERPEKDFHHPYQPYDIQKQFMTTLYNCIEDGKVGIFESPTGSGTHKRRLFEESLTDLGDDDEPDWIVEQARNAKRESARRERAAFEERLARAREKERQNRVRSKAGEPSKKRLRTTENPDDSSDTEARFELDNYESDNENDMNAKATTSSATGLSTETHALMRKLGLATGELANDDENSVDEVKVFYCSRTHSQLTQFSSELRKVWLPPVLPRSDLSTEELVPSSPESLTEDLRHLTLGSRKNLCINPKVNSSGSATAINERCLELQQPGVSAECRCSYLPNKENETLVHDFRDNALAKIRDIEDLGSLGRKLGICPYYATRSAIAPAEIVTLPYPLLLQRSAREALGLSLKDHVVIVDEAHNLMDAITGIHSVSVTLKQLQTSRAQLGVYLQKFRNRLKGKNRVYVAQTVRLVDSLVAFLQSRGMNDHTANGIAKPTDLMAGKGADQINLYKLVRYLQESKLARKVEGYLVHTSEPVQKTKSESRSRSRASGSERGTTTPVLTQIQALFVALMNPSSEGRFFSVNEADGMALKYTLLDPAHHFREIVEDARAVILAGGTMSPMSDYYEHLFPYLTGSRIETLSCGHVIPSSNLLALPINQAANGADFDFTFEKRGSEVMMRELGEAILSVAENTPAGVVAFFPSYNYLNQVVSVWKKPIQQASSEQSLWDRIADCKTPFLEPRAVTSSGSDSSNSLTADHSLRIEHSGASNVHESVLTAYATAIANNNGKGALLLSVIGGSLSEGINFSDDLGRAVIVVGLPFPNPYSAEWKAKAAYVDSKASANRDKVESKAASRDFYENMCMRAVNQCIGRAIRHQNDYASILLVDRRYGLPRIQAKLPGWIRESLTTPGSVATASAQLKNFFAAKELSKARSHR